MKIKITLFLLLAVLSSIEITSQNNRNKGRDSFFEDTSFVITDLSYLNDAVFMGRRDSIAAPYLLPSVGFYHKSGLFIDVSASYLTASEEQRIDLFLISGGYYFDQKKLSTGIMGVGYFFNNESYNVQSEMNASISGLLSYDLTALEVSITASSIFNTSGSVDFFGELGLERTFSLDDNSFLITPTVALGAGTQNFYEAYYQSNRLGNRKDKPGGSSGSTISSTLKIDESSQFKFLNVELSLPIHYSYKSFIFSVTPNLSIPQSSASITIDDLVIEEDLQTIFHWSAGISYWFYSKKKK